MAEIRLGTSGWSYDDWVGAFYPSKDESKLSYYSGLFRTAEIDSTFYAYPNRGVVLGWSRHTPPDFVFCAKLPGLITHEKELDLRQQVEEDLIRFLDLMTPLSRSHKLGVLLIQLPPRFKRDYDRLEEFLSILPSDQRFAVEFRHKSWWKDETWKLLRKYHVANTIVDEPLLPPDPVVTADFSFIRWHGRGERPWYNYRYQLDELKPWVPKLNEVSSKTKEIFGYFNNHFHGYAVENCLQVLELLGSATTGQIWAKERVQRYLQIKLETAKEVESTLLEFVPQAEEDLQKLLTDLLGRARMSRALRIEDSEVSELTVKGTMIKARVRDYDLVIDSDQKVIMHDCADWARCIPTKQFCKHLGKVFLMMPKDDALRILQAIIDDKERWEFKPLVSS